MKTSDLRKAIQDQRKWIESCSSNPKSSYYGENAAAVKKADADALAKLEKELAGRRK